MKALERLILNLRRLPGVGPRQAERLSLHLLRAPQSEVAELATAIVEAKARTGRCARCQNLSEEELCRLCRDDARDPGLLCVVEDPQDVAALERSGAFRGTYHVLHGALSPIDGIGPEALTVQALLERIAAGSVREVVVATDPDTEGEATALYLAQELRRFPVKVTRIAHGVPLGGDLDYTDELTLSHAMSGRREM